MRPRAKFRTAVCESEIIILGDGLRVIAWAIAASSAVAGEVVRRVRVERGGENWGR